MRGTSFRQEFEFGWYDTTAARIANHLHHFWMDGQEKQSINKQAPQRDSAEER